MICFPTGKKSWVRQVDGGIFLTTLRHRSRDLRYSRFCVIIISAPPPPPPRSHQKQFLEVPEKEALENTLKSYLNVKNCIKLKSFSTYLKERNVNSGLQASAEAIFSLKIYRGQ